MKKAISILIVVLILMLPIAFSVQEGTFFYHNDRLGSPRVITDADGNIVWSSDYEDFGKPVNEEGESDYKYTGKELDNETGLYYYGARYYDPETGRFVTADKIETFPNPYIYARNNPLRYVDPTGESVTSSWTTMEDETNIQLESLIESGGMLADPTKPATEFSLKRSYEHVKKLFTGDFKGFIEDYEDYNPTIGFGASTLPSGQAAKAGKGLIQIFRTANVRAGKEAVGINIKPETLEAGRRGISSIWGGEYEKDFIRMFSRGDVIKEATKRGIIPEGATADRMLDVWRRQGQKGVDAFSRATAELKRLASELANK